MFVKTFIATTVLATALFGTVATAQANHMSFGIGFGFPIVSPPPPPPGGPMPPPPGPGPFPGSVSVGFQFGMSGHGHHHGHHHRRWGHQHNHTNYGLSCQTGRNIVRSSGFSRVKSIDCTAPIYGYLGVKNGHLYKVRVNSNGAIISATVIY